VCAISLRAGKREHAHTRLAAPARHAGQMPDVPSRAWKNERRDNCYYVQVFMINQFRISYFLDAVYNGKILLIYLYYITRILNSWISICSK
jgi:hypothetical protein